MRQMKAALALVCGLMWGSAATDLAESAILAVHEEADQVMAKYEVSE
jgi:hypothetical protein